MAVEVKNFTKLNEDNYVAWSIITTTLLESKSLHVALWTDQKIQAEGITEQTITQKRLEAKLILLMSINNNLLQQVIGCESPRDIWLRLKSIHDQSSETNVSRLLQKFFSFRRSQEPMSQYIGEMEAMRRQLSNLGEAISDQVFIMQLLNGLPSVYETLKEIWDTTEPKRKTVPELISRILQREADLNNAEQTATAFLTIAERKKKTRCAKCGHKGHWAKECVTDPKDYYSKEDREQALIADAIPPEVVMKHIAF